MAEQAELMIPEQQALSPRMTMLEFAMRQNASLEQLDKLMSLQERYDANEARKAFVQAMSDFKAHSIVITKDKVNTQYSKPGAPAMYTSLGNLVTTVTPFLSQHGLSAGWEIDQTSGITVTCIIRHSAGHSESVKMAVPPDKSGAKNPLQEIKSAITYAKACTFESICGLASTDANVDDDGNGFSNGELAEKIEWIENASNPAELKKLYEQAYRKFTGNPNAQKAIIAAKDRKKVEFTQ